MYGRRYRSFNDVRVARHRVARICRFQNGSPVSREEDVVESDVTMNRNDEGLRIVHAEWIDPRAVGLSQTRWRLAGIHAARKRPRP